MTSTNFLIDINKEGKEGDDLISYHSFLLTSTQEYFPPNIKLSS